MHIRFAQSRSSSQPSVHIRLGHVSSYSSQEREYYFWSAVALYLHIMKLQLTVFKTQELCKGRRSGPTISSSIRRRISSVALLPTKTPAQNIKWQFIGSNDEICDDTNFPGSLKTYFMTWESTYSTKYYEKGLDWDTLKDIKPSLWISSLHSSFCNVMFIGYTWVI